jgi:subtilisin family serine protease
MPSPTPFLVRLQLTKLLKYIGAVVCVLGLVACKGGDNDPQLTGQFVGEPVVGLTYACGSGANATSGLTNEAGEFTYRASQTCLFSVGNITLGNATSIPCNGKIVPQDVAHVVRSATGVPTVLAIAQFLQSLNAGTLAGKLVIASSTQSSLVSAPVNVLTSSSGAISQAELQGILSLAGKAMVTPLQAKSYLNTQIASGAIDASCGVVSAATTPTLNSISVSSSTDKIPAGLTLQMTATGYYSDGSEKDLSNKVTWSSADTTLLMVDATGLALGRKKGSAMLTASFTPQGAATAVKGSMLQNIIEPVLQSISISNTASPAAGFTDAMKATGVFSDGSTTDLTTMVSWSSSDTHIFTINASGVVTGLIQGVATVFASYLPPGANASITGTFSETILAPTVVNIVISYVTNGLQSIYKNSSTFLQAILGFSNKTTEVVSSLVNWVVATVSGNGMANIAVDRASNSASLTGSSPGVISVLASYLGLTSNSLSLSINALPPTGSNLNLSLNVMGVAPSTVTSNISAIDPQGLPITYSIVQDGAVGRAVIHATTGALSYTVLGHTSSSQDVILVGVSNGLQSSNVTVSIALKTDALIANQWHLQNVGYSAFASVLPITGNDMNVAGAWGAGYTGKGIKVAVVDSGLEIGHEDLAANVDAAKSFNFLTGGNDPTPTSAGFDHGTAVAGIIGSVAFNGKGGRGVAYEASLRGFNLLANGASSLTNFGNALGLSSYSSDVDIFNESFGSTSTQLPPQVNSYNAINTNALTLRGGKGAILVQSAGNSFSSFGNFASVCTQAKAYGVSCGSSSSDTRRDGTLPIVVGAMAADGTKSSYSNAGSSLWISAPGGEFGRNTSFVPGATGSSIEPAIVTTSLSGCNNYSSSVNALDSLGANPLAAKCQYTATMNGTSSAAPNLSGVIALMLHANPNLGYRDVKYILAKTAKKTDAGNVGVTTSGLISGASVTLDLGWVRNAAGYWFSNWYGFGAVDASAAVTAAKNYTNYLAAMQSVNVTNNFTSTENVPQYSTAGSTLTFTMNPSFSTVEHAMVVLNMTDSPGLACNQIELISPSGTKSILMNALNGYSNNGVPQQSITNSRILSNAFYGETAQGAWRLKIYDFCPSSVGSRTTFLSTDVQTLLLTGH